jgi:hypothetical protein
MEELTKLWNEYKKDQNVDEIATSLRESKNQYVWTIPYTKKEWFALDDDERLHCQLRYPRKIAEANELLAKKKIESNYK